ncbi:hypothetical protein M514_11193 [Trichuris suis]|uniref:Uncharacterized protein n=1 Tax=Trichuris suis TaxID=68888 RepID=A0A085NET3_9BILA|nr:hypothetical protein M513_11193 [Trichuris suis]KFD67979.1 hypothetical protein M514_11193 [Trichuris suis]
MYPPYSHYSELLPHSSNPNKFLLQAIEERYTSNALSVIAERAFHVASVVPLHLTGGASAVYLQLSHQQKKKVQEVTLAINAVFAVDPFVAYEQFVMRRLDPDELPDVFGLTCSWHLYSALYPKRHCVPSCGPAGALRQLLKDGSRLENLNLSQIPAWAQAVITDGRAIDSRKTCFGDKDEKFSLPAAASARRYYAFEVPKRFITNCTAQRLESAKGENGSGPRL